MSRHVRWIHSFEWPFDFQIAHLQFAAYKNEKIHSEPSSASYFWWKWKRGHRAAIQMGRFLGGRQCGLSSRRHRHIWSEVEVAGAEATPAERFKSKNGNIFWSSVPHDVHSRAAAANVIKMTSGITRFALTKVSDIKRCFELFMPLSLKRIIITMINLEGKKVHGDMWKDIDEEYLDAFIGVLLLAGVYRCCNEATDSLWDASTGRNIFWATMSLHTFDIILIQESSDLTTKRPDRGLASLLPSGMSGRDGCSFFHWCSSQGQRWQRMNVLSTFRGKRPYRQYITYPVSQGNTAENSGKPVMQKPTMAGMYRFSQSKLRVAPLRRNNENVWSSIWPLDCRITISAVIFYFIPDMTSDKNFTKETSQRCSCIIGKW